MLTDEYLEKLMNEYGNEILRMCYLYLKDYHLAQDAAQETFMKAMKAYDTFKHESSEKTWLTRIAINCCKNVMRTRWFRSVQNNLEDHMQAGSSNPIEDYLETYSLSRSIMKLNDSDRKLIVLYYYQELSVKEIAVVINKTENATIQSLSRARKKLKKILEDAGYERRGTETNP